MSGDWRADQLPHQHVCGAFVAGFCFLCDFEVAFCDHDLETNLFVVVKFRTPFFM
jgi:hypothetical protein